MVAFQHPNNTHSTSGLKRRSMRQMVGTAAMHSADDSKNSSALSAALKGSSKQRTKRVEKNVKKPSVRDFQFLLRSHMYFTTLPVCGNCVCC